MSALFDMAPYALFVWPAYALSALAIGALSAWSLFARARARRALAALEANGT